MQTVFISLQASYGNVKAYPRNQAAETFAAIAGTRTLTIATLAHIAKLGYEIVLINGDNLTMSDLTS